MESVSNQVEGTPERFVPDESFGQMIEAEHLVRYWWASQLAHGRRVLDAGCGVGYGTQIMHASGAVTATGVDAAAYAIDEARAKAPDGPAYDVGDLRDLPYDDAAFDLIVCFEVIEHIHEQELVIDGLLRLLSDDGILLVSSPNPATYRQGNPHHVHELGPRELQSLMAARLPEVTLWGQHQWLASAIQRPEELGKTGLEPIDWRFAKTAAIAPERVTYSIAVCSRQPVETVLQPSSVATGDVDFSRWSKLWNEQQGVLIDQRAYIRDRLDSVDELQAARRELRNSEAEVQRLTEVLAEAGISAGNAARARKGSVRSVAHRIKASAGQILRRAGLRR